jgi:phosphohistidine phosphatase
MGSDQIHQLIIMRHAKSDWGAEHECDFDRPLSVRGRKEAELMARWSSEQTFIPDIILSSPALRAKETTHIICNILGINLSTIIWEKEIYDASTGDLLKVIERNANDINTMLMIDHNPGMDTLLCFLSKNDPKLTASGKIMTTSALAILSYQKGLIKTEPQSATLKCLMRPKEI